MKASEIFDNYYKQLTEKARKVIESSDQFFDEWAGNFDNAEEFNRFVEENFSDDDFN